MKIIITINADDRKEALKVLKSVSDCMKRDLPESKAIKKGYYYYNAGFEFSGNYEINAKP